MMSIKRQYMGIAASLVGVCAAVAGVVIESPPETVRFGLIIGGVILGVSGGQLWKDLLTDWWDYDERRTRIRHRAGFNTFLATLGLLLALELGLSATTVSLGATDVISSVLVVAGLVFLASDAWYQWTS